jgi:hypothetical protein
MNTLILCWVIFLFLLAAGGLNMNNPGMPIPWKDVEELGLQEVPPGYEQSEDEQQHQNHRKEYGEEKEKRPAKPLPGCNGQNH